MNLGIYIDSIANKTILSELNDLVNNTNKIDIYDYSIFFNEIDFNPYKINCGFFNSTELWSFSGDLIVTSLNCLATANRVINNINLYYYFGLEEKPNVFQLIELSRIAKIVCRSERDKKEFYRLTGKSPVGVSQNLEEVLQILMEQKDGHKSNLNNVYKT